MKRSLRFLVVAVAGWTGVRAASLGILPGADLFKITPSEARAPPVAATQFPAIDPPAQLQPPAYALADQPVAAPPQIIVYPVAVSAPVAPPTPTLDLLRPFPRADHYYDGAGAFDEWPLMRTAGVSLPISRPAAPEPQPAAAVLPLKGPDRLQLSAWALLRNQRQGTTGPQSLAGRGTLGGSQAGARLTYLVTPQLAATLRTSSDVGRRGGEVAAGVRVQPLSGLPLWLTAERRQRLGRFGGGRNAFALLFESGVYQRPMPWGLSLDAYLQGGVVGARSRDKFIDGAATLTRPAYRNFSAGVGVWGGAQPGIYRIDAGPRVTMRVRNNVRVHFDYRHRLAGNAQPGSGPAVTLAGDF